MMQKKMTVRLDKDPDARPVAEFVQVASQFESVIHVEVDEKKVNAKSIMGMMSLRLAPGEEITVVTDGTDEAEAAKGIEAFLVNVK